MGDMVEGYVTSITDFGVFVEIEEGIEGLIHLSEIENGKGKHPSEILQGRRHGEGDGDQRRREGQEDRAVDKGMQEGPRKRKRSNFPREETRAFSTLGDLLEPAMRKNNKE